TNNSTLVTSLCAIVFIAYTFIYIYFTQSDVLAMMQHVLSGGLTHYDKLVGAIIITIVLYALQIGISKLTRFCGKFYALTFFPSLLLLSVLTTVNPEFEHVPFSPVWVWLAPILIIIYVIIIIVFWKNKISSSASLTRGTMIGEIWINLLVLSVMFVLVSAFGTTNKIFRYRMQMEVLLKKSQWTEALEVAQTYPHTDASLTMLRAYALSRTGQLGERFFEYPVAVGSNSLLPYKTEVRSMMISDSEITKPLSIRKKGKDVGAMDYLKYISDNGIAMKPVTDYLLCGYLLDRDLDSFVKLLKKKYNIVSTTLPKHYKEALTLYNHLRSHPVIVYSDEVMETDYSDFKKIEHQFENQTERMSYLKDYYGKTYWFYYHYPHLW
ncbi:MAG: DUF6057 family protein, partial [Prevotella sp.]|nr:DUF6057 family protein [Prevotella sp.]